MTIKRQEKILQILENNFACVYSNVEDIQLRLFRNRILYVLLHVLIMNVITRAPQMHILHISYCVSKSPLKQRKTFFKVFGDLYAKL